MFIIFLYTCPFEVFLKATGFPDRNKCFMSPLKKVAHQKFERRKPEGLWPTYSGQGNYENFPRREVWAYKLLNNGVDQDP